MSLLDHTELGAFLRMTEREAGRRQAGLSRSLEAAEIAYAASNDALDIVSTQDMIALDISLGTIGGAIPFQGASVFRLRRLSYAGKDVDLDALLASIWVMRSKRGTRLLEWNHGYASGEEVPDYVRARLLYAAEGLYLTEKMRRNPARRRIVPYPIALSESGGTDKIEPTTRLKHLAKGNGGTDTDLVPDDRKPSIEVSP